MSNIENLDAEPFITIDREWDTQHTPHMHTFKKTFMNGKCVEEEAIIDNGTFGLEFSNDKNIASFMEIQKTLVYWNTKPFTAFTKTVKDSRKDLWTNIVEVKYKYDSKNAPGLQTTTNLKLTLNAYQEVIVDKVQLHDVQIRYLQVGGKYKKNPLQDCVQHMQCWNKVYNVSMNLPVGLLSEPGKVEKVQWYYDVCKTSSSCFQGS